MFEFCLLLDFIGRVQYIRSQKKNAQLVYNGCIFNKKQTQGNGHTTWRCVDVVKSKCRAVCITKNSKLMAFRRTHNHEPHWNRILNRALYDVEDALDNQYDKTMECHLLRIGTHNSYEFMVEDDDDELSDSPDVQDEEKEENSFEKLEYKI